VSENIASAIDTDAYFPKTRRQTARPKVLKMRQDQDDEGKIKQAGSKPREQMTISTSSPASTLVEINRRL
jgi:hypothetical protein